MMWADWCILAAISASTLLGAFRGLVREAFSLAGWVAAMVVARMFYRDLDRLLVDSISTPSVRMVAAFLLLFVATLLISSMLAYLVQTLTQAAGLGWSDRLLGAAFGVARGLILTLVLLMSAAPYVAKDPWWQRSRLAPVFMHYAFFGQELRQRVTDFTLHAGEK